MSTPLIIGGVVLGAAVLAGVVFMGKKREETEDTGFGVENPVSNSQEYQGGRRSRRQRRRQKNRSRRNRRVKI